ncbi:O-acetyl-ADP-ribose deacetylase (regulator of RNase III) [Breznakia blatticola]|uniref:O-acetyl-ADP-ribose deacetylase (Regulator of RNase III) n=1 Tax=Breznakia blatticola TaxID=1754012 RepID=A0A4R7ZAI4_9FIRM|nr:macro domain-containing protein [Breznakia blatticola]TDW11826.1 O-acetyl-ADP-ribose deacetylase (regulator of RNase III) [Breznakia blatticola]
MLTFVQGDLFNSPAKVLVNTVNTVGVMGKGIAAKFKKEYPDMFSKYHYFCKNNMFDIGKLYLYTESDKWILNFPTKKHWRNKSEYEYIEKGLEKFVDTYQEKGITSIAFPKLGCGNGGLDWNIVREMMINYLSNLPIDIYVYEKDIDVTKEYELENNLVIDDIDISSFTNFYDYFVNSNSKFSETFANNRDELEHFWLTLTNKGFVSEDDIDFKDYEIKSVVLQKLKVLNNIDHCKMFSIKKKKYIDAIQITPSQSKDFMNVEICNG